MNQKESQNASLTLRLVGVIFLILLWVALVWVLLSQSGVNLKNILVGAFSGIIIVYPLWRKYIQPLIDARKEGSSRN